MKTSIPRDLLLRRHQNAEPRLNALREAALRRLPARAPNPDLLPWWRVAGRELFWPARLAWVGIGVLGLCALGLDQVVSRSEPARRSGLNVALRTRAATEEVSRIRRLQDAQLAQWMEETLTAPAPANGPSSPAPEPLPPASPRRQRSSLSPSVWVA